MSSFSQLAYDHIRSKLAHGLPGLRELSEPLLARELGISRTPIREAIRQLESEGLLEQRAKRGTFVRRPDRQELDEIYQVRLLLEPFAAAEAARLLDAASLRKLDDLLAAMRDVIEQSRAVASESDRDRLLQIHAVHDTDFHAVIVRGGNNRRIVKIVADANVLAMAMSFPKDSPRGALPSMARSYREHKRILQALRRRDAAAARDAMSQHLTRARASTLAYFDYLQQHTPSG
jgi:DNA-binding GntR family transcriptional regulator